MVTKILGYVLSIVGLIGLASTIESLAKFIPITIPKDVATLPINIISIVLIVAGIILIIMKQSGSSTRGREIPIYQGKHIVGYRKH